MKNCARSEPEDNAAYLREWAADIRRHNGKSVDADRLDSIAAEIEELRYRLQPAAAAEESSNSEGVDNKS